ncbi:MAG: hypothetical protein HC848_02765 [Limnobacter sp.]|nr:hypothetical protein [Limnobacter sp.]
MAGVAGSTLGGFLLGPLLGAQEAAPSDPKPIATQGHHIKHSSFLLL